MVRAFRPDRAGVYIAQSEGYRAFIPAPLPPNPPIHIDPELTKLLSDADRALGRLDGVATVMPNADLFVAMYVKHEAVLSSQIEGTQSTLEDVLGYEIDSKGKRRPKDVAEVVNYVRAMNNGLAQLPTFPLSLRLIRLIHEELLRGVRGSHRTPGQFRTSQNWIGPAGCTLQDAEFVPPPPHELLAALDNFEKFLHDDRTLPTLIQCAVAHAQFETIHPFLDGNGRVGRLLITLFLCEREVLQRPLLYLSYYLKAHRSQYYDRLTAIRNDGDWEGWLRFFLRGIAEVSGTATKTARSILKLREEHRELISSTLPHNANALRLLDFLFEHPLMSVRMAAEYLDCAYATANRIVSGLDLIGLKEITGQQRNRLYRYDPYLEIFDKQALSMPVREDL